MLFEPTTISSAASAIAETLEKHYNQDPVAVFKKAGLDPKLLDIPDARYPFRQMRKLWATALEVTGDECFGLVTGTVIRPTSFHALGFAWLASQTLHEALQRLCRYCRLISTVPLRLDIRESATHYTLHLDTSEYDQEPPPPSIDAFTVSIVSLCRQASDKHFAPTQVTLARPDNGRIDQYIDVFQAPVTLDADSITLSFDRQQLDAPLPGHNRDLAIANDKVAEQYLEAMEPDRVSTQVKRILIELLPSGETTQKMIARQMNRSLSTLQRQLSAEGTSYKLIQEDTRRTLAEEYVREGNMSLSQIAYLLGFSDQSNFSRAFKRWTGSSPGSFRH
ncbi:MAG: AraC family transcriptional regulator [Gammaproteobacteria bacterium]